MPNTEINSIQAYFGFFIFQNNLKLKRKIFCITKNNRIIVAATKPIDEIGLLTVSKTEKVFTLMIFVKFKNFITKVVKI